MPGYVIAEIEITDPTAFEEYRKQVPATVQKYSGKFLARGGTEEYRGPKALRMKTSRGKLILVEGIS